VVRKEENFVALSCEKLYDSDRADPQYIILDGQQRLRLYTMRFGAPAFLPGPNTRAFINRVDKFVAEESTSLSIRLESQRWPNSLTTSGRVRGTYLPTNGLAMAGGASELDPEIREFWKDRADEALRWQRRPCSTSQEPRSERYHVW